MLECFFPDSLVSIAIKMQEMLENVDTILLDTDDLLEVDVKKNYGDFGENAAGAVNGGRGAGARCGTANA